MANYELTETESIRRTSDGACIPPDPANKDYAEYLEWAAIDGNIADPYVPPLPPVPQTISDRQFFQQLAVATIITPAEALAAVKTGDIPATIQALLELMPPEQQFGAEMILSGATIFERQHPMTLFIGQAYGWTEQQVDDFFTAASQL